MTSIFSFIIFISIVWTVMFLMHVIAWVPLSRVFSLSLPYWPVWLGLLASSYLLASAAVRTIGGLWADYLYFAAATWLGVVFLLFSTMLVYQLQYMVTGFESRGVVIGLVVLVAGASVHALFAGHALTTKEYTVAVEHLEQPVRIVHLADIHVGTVHQSEYLRRVVEATNAAKSDLVLITGDLFDGSAPIDTSILSPLNDLEAPSYFSNGNHEEYEGLKLVSDTVGPLDLTLLANEKIDWQGIQLVGVNDRQSLRNTSLAEVLDSLELVPGAPTILMYHSPSDWAVARERGVGLMLSGHTHNGQIWPFTLLVKLAFPYINGLYAEEGKSLHVTPGTGTWGPPMRLGSHNQVTVLHLVPAE
ncbi:metallophosphoesterase [Candidatus Nomurabacteria bacterium]|nr:metallophosphoesterase [Candidatus Nomurabacteria bacterium]